MASALPKMRSIMSRIGQRCDHRIEAQPMAMRTLLIGAYPLTPLGGSCWACSTYGRIRGLVTVEGSLNRFMRGAGHSVVYVAELASQDLCADQRQAGAQAGQRTWAVAGIPEQYHAAARPSVQPDLSHRLEVEVGSVAGGAHEPRRFPADIGEVALQQVQLGSTVLSVKRLG